MACSITLNAISDTIQNRLVQKFGSNITFRATQGDTVLMTVEESVLPEVISELNIIRSEFHTDTYGELFYDARPLLERYTQNIADYTEASTEIDSAQPVIDNAAAVSDKEEAVLFSSRWVQDSVVKDTFTLKAFTPVIREWTSETKAYSNEQLINLKKKVKQFNAEYGTNFSFIINTINREQGLWRVERVMPTSKFTDKFIDYVNAHVKDTQTYTAPVEPLSAQLSFSFEEAIAVKDIGEYARKTNEDMLNTYALLPSRHLSEALTEQKVKNESAVSSSKKDFSRLTYQPSEQNYDNYLDYKKTLLSLVVFRI